jgi:crossover junction endodeoxyribonuclease RuvC
MAYLGIDPGLHGGWALLCPAGRLIDCAPLPLDRNAAIDAAALADRWRACPPIRLTAVELVHAMPGQGVSSMFTFGETVGRLIGVLGALGHVPVRPTPQRWQKALAVSLPADWPEQDKTARRREVKRRAAEAAVRLAGDQAARLTMPRCRGQHDGLVDALLIAEWLRNHHTVGQPWDA